MHNENSICTESQLTDDCRLQHNGLKNNRISYDVFLYKDKMMVPGSISPFIIPITLYVLFDCRRLYVFTSILLF
jgi:hypothetical protein